MNPLKWPKQERIALLIFIGTGFLIGVAFGYLAYAAGSGADGARDFWYHFHSGWVSTHSTEWMLAGLYGCLVIGCLAYASNLMRKSL